MTETRTALVELDEDCGDGERNLICPRCAARNDQGNLHHGILAAGGGRGGGLS